MGCAQGKRELLRNDGSGFLMLELRVEQELAGQIQEYLCRQMGSFQAGRSSRATFT